MRPLPRRIDADRFPTLALTLVNLSKSVHGDKLCISFRTLPCRHTAGRMTPPTAYRHRPVLHAATISQVTVNSVFTTSHTDPSGWRKGLEGVFFEPSAPPIRGAGPRPVRGE